MNFSDWIEAERGRHSLVADRFGVTVSAVTQWKTNGVPIDRMAAVRDLSGGEVTIEDMVVSRCSEKAAA